MQTYKSEKIKQISKKMYNENEKSLRISSRNLIWQNLQWFDVLQAGDWSILEELYLYDCGINDDIMTILFRLNWSRLTCLSLSKNYLKDRGLKLMLDCNFSKLKKLDLSLNLIGNQGIKYLVKNNLPNLKKLRIVYCKIESEGFKNLTKGRWPLLSDLWLGFGESDKENKIELNGWQMIGQNLFSKLSSLFIRSAEPICWINSVLIEKWDAKIREDQIIINNWKLLQLIKEIFKNRNL